VRRSWYPFSPCWSASLRKQHRQAVRCAIVEIRHRKRLDAYAWRFHLITPAVSRRGRIGWRRAQSRPSQLHGTAAASLFAKSASGSEHIPHLRSAPLRIPFIKGCRSATSRFPEPTVQGSQFPCSVRPSGGPGSPFASTCAPCHFRVGPRLLGAERGALPAPDARPLFPTLPR